MTVTITYLQEINFKQVVSNSYIVYVAPLFPPKRNHNLVIRDHYDMDHSSGLEHANTFY